MFHNLHHTRIFNKNYDCTSNRNVIKLIRLEPDVIILYVQTRKSEYERATYIMQHMATYRNQLNCSNCGPVLSLSLYGAEHYPRDQQLCIHSIFSLHYMEPEGSLPNSQDLFTCTYPEPEQSNPHHPTLSLQDPSSYYQPPYNLVLLENSFLLAFYQ
jgi:hypothetical protein